MERELIGNVALKEALFGRIRDGRSCSFYIIEGAEGTGKYTAARLAAAALCCHSRKSDGMPCGECDSCRKILDTGHVDVSDIEPEKDRASIGVDPVRIMLEQSFLIPSEADWRIFIIPHAEILTIPAQNVMLKSLEEPGSNVIFFLLTSDASKLLPTVISRAFKLNTQLLPDETIRGVLHERFSELEGEAISRIIRFSGGSLGKALGYAENGISFDEYNLVMNYFTAIANGKHHAVLCEIFPPAGIKRDKLSLILTMIKSALRDIILFLTDSGATPVFFDDRAILRRSAYVLESKRAVAMFDKISYLSELNTSYVNPFTIISEINILFS